MTNDIITLLVNGQKLTRFTAYEVDADMYAGASAFWFEAANADVTVKAGQPCQMFVNSTQVLNGYIDAVDSTSDKKSSTLRLEGRDLMGVLVDWYITTGQDINDASMQSIAITLLSDVPVINLKNVEYGKGVFVSQQSTVLRPRVEVGQTKFLALKSLAAQHGLLFYCKPDGRLVFGCPLTDGAETPAFAIAYMQTAANAKAAHVRTDISKRYATTTAALAWLEGLPTTTANNLGWASVAGSLADADYPPYAPQKPYAFADNSVGAYINMRLRQMQAEQRHQSFMAIYTVSGHTCQGNVWDINKLCRVDDAKNNLHGNFLITKRTFTKSKENGTETKVQLSLPGVRA
jgi:prophage tail gpP-like protein